MRVMRVSSVRCSASDSGVEVGEFGDIGWARSEGVDGGALDGEAGAVAVEVGGEAGDVVGVGVDGVELGAAKTRSLR